MNPGAVMISHHSRGGKSGLRAQSLQQLALAGARPDVMISTVERGSDAEVKRISWWAISTARDNPDGVLFFEDDILVDSIGLEWFARGPRPAHDLVLLCTLRASLHGVPRPQEPYHLAPIPRERFAAERGFHGCMGMWLSADLVDTIVSSRSHFMAPDDQPATTPVTPTEVRRGKVCGFDFWLRDFVNDPASLLPDVIKHRSDARSTIR